MRDHIRILVADTDDAVRHTIIEALARRDRGIAIEEVTGCSEATEALTKGGFDCAFLDSNFKDSDSVSCLHTVRNAGVTTPVILISNIGADYETIGTGELGSTITVSRHDLSIPLIETCLSSSLRFHKSEQEIRQVQDDLRLRDSAIAASPNGIVICDPHQADWPIIYCNPAFTNITGYNREEVIGHNPRMLQGRETDDYYVQQIRDCLREERECQIVLRNYRKDGTPFWNELSIAPVRDADGKLTHFIGVQTDITERRKAEDALVQSVKHHHAMLRDVFATATGGTLRLCKSEDELPQSLNQFIEPISLAGTSDVRTLRKHAVKACLSVGIPDERCDDMEVACGELATNAVVHSQAGVGHVFTHEEHGTVQVRVTDQGKGIAEKDLPNATLKPGYSTAGTMGQGFKIIIKLVDRVHLLTGSGGTTVVIEQDRVAPSPSW